VRLVWLTSFGHRLDCSGPRFDGFGNFYSSGSHLALSCHYWPRPGGSTFRYFFASPFLSFSSHITGFCFVGLEWYLSFSLIRKDGR